MTIVEHARGSAATRVDHGMATGLPPGVSRPLLAAVVLLAFAAGLLVVSRPSSAAAVLQAGDDLTRLLRFMAIIKAVLAASAIAAVAWRLGTEVSRGWFAAYGAAAAAMAAGPGLIWCMAHVGLGALLLHGGLLASILLLWRDPAFSARLEAALARRRAAGAR